MAHGTPDGTPFQPITLNIPAKAWIPVISGYIVILTGGTMLPLSADFNSLCFESWV